MLSSVDESEARPRGVTGVVLAGGGSTRMGTSKAALAIAGEPLVRRVVRRLEGALARVIVVGPPELGPLVAGIELLPDDRPGVGPLGGIATALRAAGDDHVFVVACDMPFVAPALVAALARAALRDSSVDALVLRTARGREPLHAVYAPSCLPVIARQLDAGDLALQHLLQHLRAREVPLETMAAHDPLGLSTLNVNTPEEWERALQLAENPPSPPAHPLDQ